MTRLHVWLYGGMTVWMRGADVSCVGHSGMLGIFILGGAGAGGILGGAVGRLYSCMNYSSIFDVWTRRFS